MRRRTRAVQSDRLAGPDAGRVSSSRWSRDGRTRDDRRVRASTSIDDNDDEPRNARPLAPRTSRTLERAIRRSETASRTTTWLASERFRHNETRRRARRRSNPSIAPKRSTTMSRVSSSRFSARLALCLAVLLAFVAANPVEGKFWKWRKAKAAAKWNDADDEGDGAWSRRAAAWRRDDDDGDCDDCGTWWRAKRWRDASWWSKWSKKTTARDDDSGWVPGARRRVAKCMLGNCGSQLKKCRKDTVCRAAVQCAVGASIAPRERERRPPFARAPTRQHSDARPPPPRRPRPEKVAASEPTRNPEDARSSARSGTATMSRAPRSGASSSEAASRRPRERRRKLVQDSNETKGRENARDPNARIPNVPRRAEESSAARRSRHASRAYRCSTRDSLRCIVSSFSRRSRLHPSRRDRLRRVTPWTRRVARTPSPPTPAPRVPPARKS